MKTTDLNEGEEKEKTLNEVCKERKWSFFFALFFIGLFNNNGYVLVAAGAQNLADLFGKSSLMPAFQLSLIMFNILIRAAFAKYCIKTEHMTRMLAVSVGMIFSFLLLSVCCAFN